jgi:hypothetical protein
VAACIFFGKIAIPDLAALCISLWDCENQQPDKQTVTEFGGKS